MKLHPIQIGSARPFNQTIPAEWKEEIYAVLITPEQLASRVRDLAAAIQNEYAGKDLVIVALLNGTIMFLADLIRQLSIPLRLDFMGVSSYGASSVSRDLVFTKDLRIDVKNRHVLLVDDILDTGKTLHRVLHKLHELKPRDIKTCVLLNKQQRRVEAVEADFVGFDIPDLFVVGYGLDYAERYRNLPFVGVLHPAIYKE